MGELGPHMALLVDATSPRTGSPKTAHHWRRCHLPAKQPRQSPNTCLELVRLIGPVHFVTEMETLEPLVCTMETLRGDPCRH